MKQYTIGEVFRNKLLKNQHGQPYTNKGTVSNVLARYHHEIKQTPHGPAKLYSEATIKEANKRWD